MNPSDLLLLLPEIILAVGGMVALMVGVFMKGDRAARGSLMVSLAVLALAGIFLWSFGSSDSILLPFNGLLRQDGFGIFVKSLCLIGGGFTLLMGWQWLEAESLGKFEVPVLVVFSILGMWLMVDANSLLSLYVGLELQSLCLFVLAAIHRENRASAEAGLKYFLLGALSSGLLLYGASLVYGATGSLGFAEIATFVKPLATNPSALPIGMLVGMILVISGLAFKISAVPFHMWTPDVYEGSPTPVTSFFAVAPKVAAMALLVRILLGPFAEMHESWHQIILLLTLLSMVLGAFAAITQSSIKRLLAYSSIANMGYAMIGLTVGTSDGIASLLLYLAIYAVMTIGAFGTILLLRRGGVSLDRLSDLAGLGRHHPKTALALAIFMFSMTGIPPLAGFFGKYFVFLAAIQAGAYVLAVVGVLTSVVAAYYYLRIVKIIYFDEARGSCEAPGRVQSWVVGLAAVLVVGYFLYPNGLIDRARAAASPLFPKVTEGTDTGASHEQAARN